MRVVTFLGAMLGSSLLLGCAHHAKHIIPVAEMKNVCSVSAIDAFGRPSILTCNLGDGVQGIFVKRHENSPTPANSLHLQDRDDGE